MPKTAKKASKNKTPKTKSKKQSSQKKSKLPVFVKNPEKLYGGATVISIDIPVEEEPVFSELARPVVPVEQHEEDDTSDNLPSIFDISPVDDPLDGTPQEVRLELDTLALHLQKHPEDNAAFDKIHFYMNRYLLGLVSKKFSYVKGYEDTDIYQEALIALFKKAIPKFDPSKNMSFLNYAKMCINSHLVTILDASINRKKNKPINEAISLDHNPSGDDGDEDCLLANVISTNRKEDLPFSDMASKEVFDYVLTKLRDKLSPFEIMVLEERLSQKSYKLVASSLSKKFGTKFREKSVDNAMWRIKKKASDLLSDSDDDDVNLLN